MGVNSLPKTVTRQRRDCDLNPGPFAPESSTLTNRIPSHPTLSCNLSLAARFLTLMLHKVVWQHTRGRTEQKIYSWIEEKPDARNGWIFNNLFTANLLENQPVKFLKIGQDLPEISS